MEEQAKESLLEALEGRASLRRLLHLIGVGSIGRNMNQEDKAAWRLTDDEATALDGGEDEMQILAARDVIMANPNSKPAEAGKEAPSAVRKLLPLALAAALGAGGLWAFDTWNNFEWPGVPDTAYEVRFYNADGELIEVPRYAPTEGTP